jgi:hypothetical protein
MDGFYYLVFGVTILVIIWWCRNNDKGSEQDGLSGLLAIRAHKQTNKSPGASGR